MRAPRWMVLWVSLAVVLAAPPTSAAHEGAGGTARSDEPREDSSDEDRADDDASVDDERESSFNAESAYNRPFIAGGDSLSIGGYMEGSLNHALEDGVPDGPSFELRRFNLFFHGSLGPRIRFISELEFEHGTEEILLETAQLDYRFDRALQVRFGILLPPIGAFNQNHDAPNWEFVDRPLVSTTLLPATLSEAGAAVHGNVLLDRVGLNYQLYATNGLGDDIVGNPTGRTSIPAGKHQGLFAHDNNPSPALSGRLAARHFDVGELGVSAYWSRYNAFREEGERIALPRSVTMLAFDYQADIAETLEVRGETAYAWIEVPAGAGPEIGSQQWGTHLDVIGHLWRPTLVGDEEAELNLNLRGELVDYNLGSFDSTDRPIGDAVYALVPGVSFRPISDVVVRANYRREWHLDLAGNPPAHRGVFQFGVATYF